ncbi:MAG: oligosaccharide flippase family protein [Desulforhabdus sp.]|jgi:O-antigen/teichoic acid export membrane protein|nr:oligosaccharide flippase family protein [Desulforhabdus sp.]
MSALVKTVVQNAFFFFSSQIWDGIAGMLIVAILARYLGVEGFGSYAVVFSVVNLVVPLTFMGIQEVGIREIAGKSSDRDKGLYLGSLLQARLILLALAALIIGIVLLVMAPEQKIIYSVAIFFFAIVVGSSGELVTSSFIAAEKFQYNLFVLVIERLSLLSLILFVALLDLGFYAIFLSYVISKVLKTYFAFYFLRRYFYIIHFSFNQEWIKKIMSESYLIGLGISTGLGFQHAIVILLKQFIGLEAAGIFSAYYNLVARCQLLSTSLSKSLMPRISIEAQRNTLAYARLTNRGILLLFAAGSLLTAIFWPFKALLIKIFYGASFLRDIDGFGYLLLLLPFLFVDNILNVAIISKRLAKPFFLAKILGFLAGIILVLILIKEHGLYAAIYGITLGKLISTLIMFLLLRKGSSTVSAQCSSETRDFTPAPKQAFLRGNKVRSKVEDGNDLS